MSYILDALRRADAERQRGTVPGLHDLPLDSTLNDAPPPPATRSRRLGQVALALAVLGLAVGAGWLLRPVGQAAGGPGASAGPMRGSAPGMASGMAAGMASGNVPGAVPAAVALAQQPLAAAATPAPALPHPAGLPPAQATAPNLAAVPARPAPPPAGPATRPLPTVVAAAASRRPTVPASSAPVASMAEPVGAVASRPVAAPLAAAAPSARLPTLADLPEAQKRELGPLVVGGAMHAEQAALRIVILNGQVMHEGDKLGPDLLVQQIRLKSVVLNHRGQRFELPF